MAQGIPSRRQQNFHSTHKREVILLYHMNATAIKPVTEIKRHATEIIAQLEPSTYTYVPDAAPGMHLPSGTQPGLLAQQLEQVLPALVKDCIQLETYSENGDVLT